MAQPVARSEDRQAGAVVNSGFICCFEGPTVGVVDVVLPAQAPGIPLVEGQMFNVILAREPKALVGIAVAKEVREIVDPWFFLKRGRGGEIVELTAQNLRLHGPRLFTGT